MAIQDALNYLGYNTGNIDGIFETKTRSAVVRFQRANRLSKNGIVGCQT